MPEVPSDTGVPWEEDWRARAALADINTDLDFRAARRPYLYADDVNPIVFTYALNGAATLPARTSVAGSLTVLTATLGRGSTLTVPRGASRVSLFIVATTAPGASQWYGIDGSDDGTTWSTRNYDAANGINPMFGSSGTLVLNKGVWVVPATGLVPAGGASATPNQFSLPKYLSLVLQNSNAASVIVDYVLTVD